MDIPTLRKKSAAYATQYRDNSKRRDNSVSRYRKASRAKEEEMITICHICGEDIPTDNVNAGMMEYLIHLIRKHWDYVMLLHAASDELIADVRRIVNNG